MKRLVCAAGLIALVGAACVMPHMVSASTGEGDAELLWSESSGPHGERDPAALPLFQAIFAHDSRKVISALDHGISPNGVLYPARWSPLMVAAAYNDRNIVEILVKRGANLNYVSKDPIYGTPLAVALAYGRFYPRIDEPNFAILHYLLNSGADVNIQFGQDSDIAITAATLGRLNIVNELLGRGYRRNLPKLRRWLEIGLVSKKMQPEKGRAIATIDQLLSSK